MRLLAKIALFIFCSAFIFSCADQSGTTTNSANNAAAVTDAAAAQEITEAEVKEALESLRVSVEKNDAEGLEKIYSDDYMIVNPEGKSETKADRMEALKSGNVKYEKVEFTDPKIRTYGNTAVVVTGASGKANMNGTDTELDMLATIVFVKDKDGVREVSAHLTNKAKE